MECKINWKLQKKKYLTQTLYTKDIHIALIQETMLKDEDKWFIKGYKIYRSNATEHRKGVAILVSTELLCQTYIVYKDNIGRFLKIKIKSDNGKEYTIACAYAEPTMEHHPEIVPNEIKEADIIGGDFNQMNTGLNKIANVYHVMETGKYVERIEQPRPISDHPMIIYSKGLNIKKKNTNETIYILNKHTIKENHQNLLDYITDKKEKLQLKDPTIAKRINTREINIENINYIDEFNQIKENDKKTFKEIQNSTAKEISDLVKCNSLGKEPYQRLISLMHYKSKIVWWKPENIESFQNILSGAKELYLDKGPTVITKFQLAGIIVRLIDAMIKSNDINNIQTPEISKSTAKDKYGFNQRDIMNLIKSKTMQETIIKYRWIIQSVTNNKTGAFLLHRTSKLLLKKKKENVTSYSDLRGISIMPAILMVLDKLTINFIKNTINQFLNKNQHGGHKGYNTNSAKLGILYQSLKNKYQYSLCLDLSKAFDKVDRNILEQIIEQSFEGTTKNILKNTLVIYKYINIDINGEQIYPIRGIPQGSVYGPLMFEIYINDILTNIQSKFKEVHIQCFVDDIFIMSSNTKNNLEKAFEVLHQMIINKKMDLNIKKCEYLSPEEEDTFIDPITKNIIPKKDKVKYLGQVINRDGTAANPLNLGHMEQ